MARQKQTSRKTTSGKAPRTPMPPSYDSEDEGAVAPATAPNPETASPGKSASPDRNPRPAGEA